MKLGRWHLVIRFLSGRLLIGVDEDTRTPHPDWSGFRWRWHQWLDVRIVPNWWRR